MPLSRSADSNSTTPPLGPTLAYTRTSDAEDLPHATKKYAPLTARTDTRIFICR